MSVVSASVLEHGRRLGEVAEELEWCVQRMSVIDSLVRPTHRSTVHSLHGALVWPVAARRAEDSIDDAARILRAAAAECTIIGAALTVAAEGYAATESVVERFTQAIAAEIGHSLGVITATVGIMLLPGLISSLALGTGALSVASVFNPAGTARAIVAARAWLDARKDLLSDPRFVQLVRLSAMSADDFGLGLLQVPKSMRWILGDEGWGIVGLDTAAATGIALGRVAGALRETAVTVRPTRTDATSVAAGWADRAARIPVGAAQVRVDRYLIPGQPDRFEVYLGGTVDASGVAADEPWDMTSNVAGVAGQSSGAYRAVTAALEAAGATATSPLIVSGYSQGGLIGARLAASGDYNVRGLFTLGAPAGQVPVPDGVPWLALEHTDDLVPAAGGLFASTAAVLVQRRAISTARPDGRLALPAHQLDRYRETAALVEVSGDRRLATAAAGFRIHAGGGGGVDGVESTWYQAKREHFSPPRPK